MITSYTIAGIFIFIFLLPFENNAEINTVVPNHRPAQNVHPGYYTRLNTAITYDGGPYSPLCLSRIFTTVENKLGEIINRTTEYALTFDYLHNEENLIQNNYRKNTQQANVPIETVHRSGNHIIKVKKYMACSSGLWHKKTTIENVNNNKHVEIRIIPDKDTISIFPDINVLKDDNIFGSSNLPGSDLNDKILYELCDEDDNVNGINNMTPQGLHLVKLQDDKGAYYCYYTSKGYDLLQTQCPKDTLSIPKISMLGGKRLLIKYVEPEGVVSCYYILEQYFNKIICPSDITTLPEYNLGKYLVKYKNDKNEEICYLQFENKLQDITCPVNTNTIPTFSITGDKKNPAQYVDPSGVLHCFYREVRNVISIPCPLDSIPVLIKTIDDNNQEHCYFQLGIKMKDTACPADTSKIPVLISRTQNPKDNSVTPEYSPNENLFKYIDDNNHEHCYLQNGNILKTIVCPVDTSRIPVLTSHTKNSVMSKYSPDENLFKYIDDYNEEHCYLQNGNILKITVCPVDTSRIPEATSLTKNSMDYTVMPEYRPDENLFKYIDDNNIVHCYLQNGNILKKRVCPVDTSKIPELRITDDRPLVVTYMDHKNMVQCLSLGEQYVRDTVCPSDTSMLPVYDPYKYLVKYIDDNNQVHCFRMFRKNLKPTTCPMDTSQIPVLPVTDDNPLSVKYVDPKGITTCFSIGDQISRETVCPSDTTMLPVYDPYKYLVKYIDDNNQVHCFRMFRKNLKPTTCPVDTSQIPILPVTDDNPLTVKYVDPKGITTCFSIGDQISREIVCPLDTSMLPVYDPYKYLVKYTDDNNQLHCFHMFKKKLKLTTCPMDTSEIPVLSVTEDNPLSTKYVDPKGMTICFSIGDQNVKDIACPSDTSILPVYDPFKNLVKYTDDNMKVHCFRTLTDKLQPIICPKDTSMIPKLSVTDDNQLSVKYVDARGKTICFSIGDQIIRDIQCPSDTSMLPVYDPFKYLVKYTDDNMKVHCFRLFRDRLKPTTCPMDTSQIPNLSVTDENQLQVKHVNHGITTCYSIGDKIVRQIACPSDTSVFPEYDPHKHGQYRIAFPQDVPTENSRNLPNFSQNDLKLLSKLICKTKLSHILLRTHSINH